MVIVIVRVGVLVILLGRVLHVTNAVIWTVKMGVSVITMSMETAVYAQRDLKESFVKRKSYLHK